MPEILINDFIEIVSKSGTPKATKVKQVKHRPGYHPAFDFYKPLRESIVQTHRNGSTKSELQGFMASITDKKKLGNYPSVLDSYRSWWGRKNIVWCGTPPRANWSNSGIDVIVNPEVDIQINDIRHVVKYHFKNDPLSKYRIEVVLHLMHQVLAPLIDGDTKLSILDVRNRKLFTFSENSIDPTIEAQLQAESAYISNLWPHM